MEIDHVLNEALASRPAELKEVLGRHGLPETFDLAGRLNRVCACKRCNSKKGADRPIALIEFGLKAAKEKTPIVEELLEKFRVDTKVDGALSRVGIAVESGGTTREYVAAFLEIETSPSAPTNVLQESEILRILGNASTGLLNWPQRTGGTWLERSELDSLLAQLDRPHSFTVLLGEPGSGKSALLAHVAEGLSQDGVALLALKADLLPPDLGTLAALDEYLGTPAPVAESLKELAQSRTVVFLIDQLDAVSELMVQRTSRLTVLLSLVNRLRGIENIHIVLSCRTFEFKHDLRLTSLRPEPVTLHDPAFPAVEALLTTARIDCTEWPSEAKELLRRPQHLNFFIRHLSQDGTPAFRSYQAMMESVLHARISRPFGQTTARALETIAAAMSDEENLWLPVSRFERTYGTEIDRLVAADLLSYSTDRVRLGFRHQTIFDFVRARAFASGVASLAQHVLERQDSLFVRPILWSTLHYLREADRGAYSRELQILWTNSGLRQHIRFLIIAFLGQVSDPDFIEIGLVRPALSDLEVRAQVVKCIQGNPAWFTQIVGDLPAMMLGDDTSAYCAAWLLRPALNFDTGTALSLIERCWIPDAHRDGITIHTLGELKQWEERAIRIAETAIRRNPQQDVWVRHLEEVVAQSRPDLASRLVAAELWGSLEKVEAQPVAVPEPPPDDASETEQISYALHYGDASYAAVKSIVTDSNSRWYGITKIARAAPRTFVEEMWPWILHVAEKHMREKTRRTLTYREDHIFGDANRIQEDLTSCLEAAIAGFADVEPDAFVAFASRNHDSDLQNVHRWLAIGYCRLGRMKPQQCAEYLLADSRRFALGPLENQHKETNELISAFAPYANPEVLKALEEKICNWVYYLDAPDLDAQARFDRMKWGREHRLRVLRAIPKNLLSPQAAKLIAEEERALPNTPERDIGPVEFQKIGSPVVAEKMAMASREDLLGLFDELHDDTGWNHPRDFMKGGVVETSRAFGELAKSHPDLVLLRLKDLKSGRHEHYASEAIQKLAESEQCDPGGLVKVIHELSAKGFRAEVFKYGASWSLAKLAEKLQGLDDATCALLEGWLEEWAGKTDEPNSDEDSGDRPLDKNARSVLWDGRGDVLPEGNYPPLHALFLGYLLRKPSDANSWLTVLERHSRRREDPRVWIALARHELTFLGQADRGRVSRLMESVLAQPKVVSSENVARLIARVHGWLPESLTHFCLQQWRRGSWCLGPQAAAEVAMLRHGLVPEDAYCSELVENIIKGKLAKTEQLPAMRIGVTFAAGEIWDFPKARSEATRVLLAVLPCTDESLAHAWRTVFNAPWPMADDCSRQILDAICQNREILRVKHGGNLVDRLKELLERSLEPERVCSVVTALLDECGDAVGDFRTAWVASAGDLIDVALTLQRLPGTSLCGLRLFERLMAGNAYQIEDVLKNLDRRWPS